MKRLLIAATLVSLAACTSEQQPPVAQQPVAQPAANTDRTASAGETIIKDGSHTLRYGGVGPLGVEFYADNQPLVLPNSATTFPWQGRRVHILDAEQANLLFLVEPPVAGS
jgi:hypothetical protein